jgi:hypothetical protein
MTNFEMKGIGRLRGVVWINGWRWIFILVCLLSCSDSARRLIHSLH